MDFDDKIRGKLGIAISLRDMGNGHSRLFVDDVVADRETAPERWTHVAFCTSTQELDNAELDAMQLRAEQFEHIGAIVVARLLALNGRIK